MRLRPAEASDADLVARIYIDSWNEGFGHLLGIRDLLPDRVDRWRHDLASQRVEWTVAEADHAIVGFVGLGPSRDPIDPELGELDTIAVDPSQWRHGIGSALMAHALRQLSQRWSRAILWTPAGYDRGHSFYLATGWHPTGLERAAGTEVAFTRSFASEPNESR